ncbi:metallophosphoesterase [Leadbetterella sp. DM7]|uniref:metallophosphoesterase n=1 Tax=Leadbetterella sp. DM7 TaxID=3235085 RepID=UPI00349E7861
MNRTVLTILVITFFIAVDYFFFKALKDSIRNFQASTQRWITLGYWAIPVIFILGFIYLFFLAPETTSPKVKRYFGVAVFMIYSSKMIGAIVYLLGNGLNILKNTGRKIIRPSSTESILTRSEFIAKSAMALGVTQFGILTYGILSGAYDYRVRRVSLPLKGLPKQFHGMTLAQLSDIHSGSFYNKKAVNGGIDMLLAEKPDVVFFTGDLVNDRATELQEYFDTFKRVQAPLGVFSTLGNHDYGDYASWASPRAKQQNLLNLMEGHRLMGWDLLMDENRSITLGGEKLGIIGIQNWGAGFTQKGDLKKALQGSEEFTNKLLLSHDPSHWRAQVLGQTDIDAAFAGHTHGMQFGIEIPGFRWSPAQYRYKEWAGMYEENGQMLYVNRGFGFLGYPGRVGILPEITIFTLQAV